ncbi:MAG TPA: type II toxin-antitoxin system VapC family toxin [Terracidiphilus sp.]
MNEIVLFDTSILIADLRTGCHSERIENCPGRIRNSAVVMAELGRGATSAAERRLVRELAASRPMLTPTEKNWMESGELLASLFAGKGLLPAKLRDLHFDVLIALTARTHGATLITSNRRDFELIRASRNFKLEIW